MFHRGLGGNDSIICKHCVENLKWHTVVPLWGIELVGKLRVKLSEVFRQSIKRLELCSQEKKMRFEKSEVHAFHTSNALKLTRTK